jgi:hypothetical protein
MLIKRLLNISPFLERMQRVILTFFPKVALPGVTRVSLGIENSAEDVDTLVQAVDNIARQPRAGTDRRSAATKNGTPILPQADIQKQMDDFARAAAQRVYAFS